MVSEINLKVNSDRSWVFDAREFGKQLENGVTKLIINIPAELNALSWQHYLEFKIPSGLATSTGALEAIYKDDMYLIEYDLSAGLIAREGTYEMQYIARNLDTEQIWKSNVARFVIGRSVNAAETIEKHEEFIVYLEKKLGDFQAVLDDILGV